MKHLLIILAVVFSQVVVAQQKARPMPLPAKMYNVLHDSCTQLDIVFLTGKGGSMSVEGRNVRFFTTFVTATPVEKKPNAAQDGLLMWQINGKEYLSGNIYFTGDSSGYIVFNRNDKEYINAFSPSGAAFLKSRGGK